MTGVSMSQNNNNDDNDDDGGCLGRDILEVQAWGNWYSRQLGCASDSG